MICCLLFGKMFLTVWHQEGEGGETERVKKKEGRGSVRNMIEDTEEGTGWQWEGGSGSREERGIVGGIWRAQRRGMGGGQWGRWKERNVEEEMKGVRKGGEIERDREGWRGKSEGEEMMRKEKLKKSGEIGERRGTGWQGVEV